MEHIRITDCVLELGCGYGRVLDELARKAPTAVGIDNCVESLRTAKRLVSPAARYKLTVMDVAHLGFRDGQFDLVLCVQNGIGVFEVEPSALVSEALRVTRSGGRVLLSSYSDRFWDHRLEWFQIQAEHGLIGAIDSGASGSGTIVSCDGFRASRMAREDFVSLTAPYGVETRIVEIDESSLFCEIVVP
jgi:2-polyprenyl-6-hydroxyphenyl methylase/3-demethylubiquinone-9 3-methyltransferase